VGPARPKRPSLRVGGAAAKHPILYALCGAWKSAIVNGPPYNTVRLANPVN